MRVITRTRTGAIVSDTELGLEYLYVGDYGKEHSEMRWSNVGAFALRCELWKGELEYSSSKSSKYMKSSSSSSSMY